MTQSTRITSKSENENEVFILIILYLPILKPITSIGIRIYKIISMRKCDSFKTQQELSFINEQVFTRAKEFGLKLSENIPNVRIFGALSQRAREAKNYKVRIS